MSKGFKPDLRPNSAVGLQLRQLARNDGAARLQKTTAQQERDFRIENGTREDDLLQFDMFPRLLAAPYKKRSESGLQIAVLGNRIVRRRVRDRGFFQDRRQKAGLSAVATIEEATGPTQIDRQNRQRQVTLLANLAPGGTLGDAVEKIEAEAKKLQMPADYRFEFSGRAKTLAESNRNFVLAFALSLIFMYMILAAQFESFIHPITIMLALPLSIPFALISLALGRGPGSASRASMAVAIIGGQSLSLLISLLVTPVAYSYFDDLTQWVRRRYIGAPPTA